MLIIISTTWKCNVSYLSLPIIKMMNKKSKKNVIRLTEKLCHRYNLITFTIIIYTFIIIYHANLSINVPLQTVELNTK